MKKSILIASMIALQSAFSNPQSTMLYAQSYQWAKSIGGPSGNFGESIVVDDSGYIYIAGRFQDTADFDPGVDTVNLTSQGSTDFYLAKYDALGNYLWAKRIGGGGEEIGSTIALDDSGYIYIAGMFSSTVDFDPGPGTANSGSAGLGDLFLAKYDTTGNYQWHFTIGTIEWDWISSITIDGIGNICVTGSFRYTTDFDPGPGIANLTANDNGDPFIAKYDPNGNYIWAKVIGSSSLGDAGSCITVDGMDNVYVTGRFQLTADFDPGISTANLTAVGQDDIFFAKYDVNGNYLWANNIGGTNPDVGNSISVDGAVNIYITGLFQNTADFNPGVGIANLTSVGLQDIFIAKYDSLGNYLWAKSIGSANNDQGGSIATKLDNIYITGYFSDTADFDPGVNTANLFSTGGVDVFFAKYDSSGNYLWAKSFDSTDVSAGSVDITIDASNNVYITGIFQGTTDFNPDTGTANLTSVGGEDIFFAKYSQCNTTSSFTPSATTICESETVNLTNTSTSATTYQWLENGVPFSTATDTARTFNTAGAYTISLIADSAGCTDSSGVIITVNPTYTINDSVISICNGDTVMIYGVPRSVAGTYYDLQVTASGCDSVRFTTLNVNPVFALSDPPVSVCTGDSALIYGTYRTTAGTYYNNFTTVNGCDSVHSTALTVNPIYNISDPAVAICTGDSAMIYGTYRTIAGTYFNILTTFAGCDSVHSTVLTINSTYSISDPAVTTCSGDSALIYGTYRTNAGTYYNNLTTVNGCDSIHSTALTVNPTYNISDPAVAICSGDSALIYGTYRTSSGTYFNNLTTVDGCDSTHSTSLTVNPTYDINDPAAAICTGDSTLIYGMYRTTAGTYYDNLMTIAGCDSIHSTTLFVNPTYNTTAIAAICSGDSTLLQGNYQTTSGTYYDTIASVNGCDSVIATSLTVHPLPAKPTITQSGIVLASSIANSYQWYYYDTLLTGATSQSHTPAKSGFYSVEITDTNGCSAMSDQFSVTVSGVGTIKGFGNLKTLIVYPNPNTGMFHIEFKIIQPEDIELKITNSLGQVIFTEKLNQIQGAYKKHLKMNEYPAGIYNLLLVTDKSVINKQIIIE